MNPEIKSKEDVIHPVKVSCSDLLAAETTLKALTDQMAAECQLSMSKWPRDWMQKHVNERACIIKARQILIDRAETAANARPDEWNVYKLNDCDWWLARSLDEAKADALISYGGDVTMIDAEAKQLSEADLDQLTYLEEYDPKDPVTTTFREHLIEMREHKAREINPQPEIFASTES